VRHGVRPPKLETKHKRANIEHIRENEGRVDSPACTWQSKEAINHEDNASPPLSEDYGVWDGGASSAEMNGERKDRERGREDS